MLAQRAAGHGRRKIAAALTAHGFPTKQGYRGRLRELVASCDEESSCNRVSHMWLHDLIYRKRRQRRADPSSGDGTWLSCLHLTSRPLQEAAFQ
jgi:hypothetical protein